MYLANERRYQEMSYARCGRSGVQLPKISLGLWQNFGGVTPYENAREMVLRCLIENARVRRAYLTGQL